MSRIKLILILTLFVLTVSCNVHTFTFGEGPSEGHSKIIKQNNYALGLVSDKVSITEYINNEKNYSFLLEQKFLLSKLLTILQDAHQDRNKLYSFRQKMNKHSDKESLMKAKQIIKDYFNGKIYP